MATFERVENRECGEGKPTCISVSVETRIKILEEALAKMALKNLELNNQVLSMANELQTAVASENLDDICDKADWLRETVMGVVKVSFAQGGINLPQKNELVQTVANAFLEFEHSVELFKK